MNAIRIGDSEFLLTVTAGDAVHLAREAGPDETGQSAVPGRYLSRRRAQSAALRRDYDTAALAQPRWAAATLCGREWIAMAEADDWGQEEPGEEATAPSCRRCLALMDKLFPEPELDDRFELVVQVITGTITEHGYAENWDVPGDQQAALRMQVRPAVKKRTGHGTQTLARGNLLVFLCEPVHQQHAAERGTRSSTGYEQRPHQTTCPVPADAVAPVLGYMGGRVTV